MQASSIALVIATGAFVVMLLWRVRPAFGGGGRAGRAAFREAQARIEAAPDEASRARALCDAAEAVGVPPIAGSSRAEGLYLRALRADPASVEVVSRAVAGLAKRPRALEAVLWRHLGSVPWRGPTAGAVVASLDALRALYEGPLKNAVRARALAHARDAAAAAGGGPQPGAQKTVGSA